MVCVCAELCWLCGGVERGACGRRSGDASNPQPVWITATPLLVISESLKTIYGCECDLCDGTMCDGYCGIELRVMVIVWLWIVDLCLWINGCGFYGCGFMVVDFIYMNCL